MAGSPPPPDDRRELSGLQRAGIVLGAIGILLIALVIIGSSGNGGDGGGSERSRSNATTTTTTTTTKTATANRGGTTTETMAQPTETTQTRQRTQASGPPVGTIRVAGGAPQGGVRKLTYRKGDEIRLKVFSDVADEVHVHGYDLKKDVPAGGSVEFGFKATIEGRFEVELENAKLQIATLEVTPA